MYSANMKSVLRIAPFLASTVAAAAIANANAPAITARAASTVNPFSGYQLYANSYYASEVTTSALPSMTGTAQTAASQVADVPSFYWL
jgi:cellulose 1,4-beta-cellobiosidase